LLQYITCRCGEIENNFSCRSRKERLKYKEKKTIERGKGKYSQKELSYYFPARKSNRVSSNQRKKENEEQLQKIILGSVEYDLEVSDEGDKGKGVRTLREFSKGDFICEYSGVHSTYTIYF
jgi:hypothetical protein